MNKPLLSIGLIFKNEIRCLERCMRSLQRIRDAVPCELVMADTGSDDGSRAVAEKYADILFDFPWTDDFAAARNAVIDKCSGEWFLSIDADEWFDEQGFGLVDFLTDRSQWTFPVCSILIRNYLSTENNGEYSDFFALRMARLNGNVHYIGAIHEALAPKDGFFDKTLVLSNEFLHHDGYLDLRKNVGKAKRERNMEMLREKLKDDPDNLRVLLQCIESCDDGREQQRYIDRALDGVEKKRPLWEHVGPPIFRQCALNAYRQKLSEFSDIVLRAKEMFPNSLYTRVDIAFYEFFYKWNDRNYEELIAIGEGYFRGASDYEKGNYEKQQLMFGSLMCSSPSKQWMVMAFLGCAYALQGRIVKARKILYNLDFGAIGTDQFKNYIKELLILHTESDFDTSPLVITLVDNMGLPNPNARIASLRVTMFEQIFGSVFTAKYRADELDSDSFHRPAHTLLLPLVHKHDLGNAAAILQTEDAAEIDGLLSEIKDWRRFPPDVVLHAIRCGAAFPPAESLLCIDDMTAIASGLSQTEGALRELMMSLDTAAIESGQDLCWLHALTTAAVRANKWVVEENANIWAPKDRDEAVDEEYSMAIAEAFAEVEGKFLRLCYSEAALGDPELTCLPTMHRFGLHMANAFALLDEGDAVGFVKTLRKALAANNEAKDMITFLTEHTEQLKPAAAPVSPELAALAEQVRTILAAYPADDPAVQVIKASPVYKQVAHLIEG